MKHFNNDTSAAIATAISGSSALITFTQAWQPVITFGSLLLLRLGSQLLLLVWVFSVLFRAFWLWCTGAKK